MAMYSARPATWLPCLLQALLLQSLWMVRCKRGEDGEGDMLELEPFEAAGLSELEAGGEVRGGASWVQLVSTNDVYKPAAMRLLDGGNVPFILEGNLFANISDAKAKAKALRALTRARRYLGMALDGLPQTFPYHFDVGHLCSGSTEENYDLCTRAVDKALPVLKHAHLRKNKTLVTGPLWRDDALGCLSSPQELQALLDEAGGSPMRFGGLVDMGLTFVAERERFLKGEDALPPGSRLRAFSLMPGDFLGPSFLSLASTRGAHMQEIFNAVGVDFVTLGNHEFDFKIKEDKVWVAESMRKAQYTSLTANVRCVHAASCDEDVNGTGGIPANKRYHIEDVGEGHKVCFFGVTSDADAAAAAANLGMEFTPYETEGIAVLKELNDKSCSLVVAMTHLDVGQDLRLWRQFLACYRDGNCPHIDVVAGAHDHYVSLMNLVNPFSKHPVRHTTYYWKMGQNGHLLSKYNFDLNWKEPPRVSVVPVPEHACADRKGQLRAAPQGGPRTWEGLNGLLRSRLDAHEERSGAKEYRAEVLDLKYNGRYDTANMGYHETRAGNMLVDAIRCSPDPVAADVSVMAKGNFRAEVFADLRTQLSAMEIHEELPFSDNMMAAAEATVWQIAGMVMEGLVERAERRQSSQRLHVSGLEVVYDVDREGGVAREHNFSGLKELRYMGGWHALGRKPTERPRDCLGGAFSTLNPPREGYVLFSEGEFRIDPGTKLTFSSNKYMMLSADPIKEPTFLRLSGEAARVESGCRRDKEKTVTSLKRSFTCKDGKMEESFYQNLDAVTKATAGTVFESLKKALHLGSKVDSGLWTAKVEHRGRQWISKDESERSLAKAAIFGIRKYRNATVGLEPASGAVATLFAQQRNLPEQRWVPAPLDGLLELEPGHDNLERLEDPHTWAALKRQVEVIGSGLRKREGGDPLQIDIADVQAEEIIEEKFRAVESYIEELKANTTRTPAAFEIPATRGAATTRGPRSAPTRTLAAGDIPATRGAATTGRPRSAPSTSRAPPPATTTAGQAASSRPSLLALALVLGLARPALAGA